MLYHSVKFLRHVVNRFGLSTLNEKVEAISAIEFPRNLHELELFLGLSDYYGGFVASYAAIMEPLLNLKTKLLKGSERKTNNAPCLPNQNHWACRTKLNSSRLTQSRRVYVQNPC